MFNRSSKERKVIILAKEEARRFNHDYIGTEHILLGYNRRGCKYGLQKLGLSWRISALK